MGFPVVTLHCPTCFLPAASIVRSFNTTGLLECKTIVFQEYNYNSKVNHQCLHSIELIFERDDFRTESERHFFSFLRCGEMNLASNPRSHMHAPSIMLRFGVQNNRFQMIHMTTCTDSKLEKYYCSQHRTSMDFILLVTH